MRRSTGAYRNTRSDTLKLQRLISVLKARGSELGTALENSASEQLQDVKKKGPSSGPVLIPHYTGDDDDSSCCSSFDENQRPEDSDMEQGDEEEPPPKDPSPKRDLPTRASSAEALNRPTTSFPKAASTSSLTTYSKTQCAADFARSLSLETGSCHSLEEEESEGMKFQPPLPKPNLPPPPLPVLEDEDGHEGFVVGSPGSSGGQLHQQAAAAAASAAPAPAVRRRRSRGLSLRSSDSSGSLADLPNRLGSDAQGKNSSSIGHDIDNPAGRPACSTHQTPTTPAPAAEQHKDTADLDALLLPAAEAAEAVEAVEAQDSNEQLSADAALLSCSQGLQQNTSADSIMSMTLPKRKHKNSLELLVAQSTSVLNTILHVANTSSAGTTGDNGTESGTSWKQTDSEKGETDQPSTEEDLPKPTDSQPEQVQASKEAPDSPTTEGDQGLTSGEEAEAEDQFQELPPMPVIQTVDADEDEEASQPPDDSEDSKDTPNGSKESISDAPEEPSDPGLLLQLPGGRKRRVKRKKSTLASQWRRQRELARSRGSTPNPPEEEDGVKAEEDSDEVAPAVPEQASFSARIATYEPPYCQPPSRTLPPPESLSEAGFFLLEVSEGEERDSVRCFHCGLVQFGWQPREEPWARHERQSPQCPWVRARRAKHRDKM